MAAPEDRPEIAKLADDISIPTALLTQVSKPESYWVHLHVPADSRFMLDMLGKTADLLSAFWPTLIVSIAGYWTKAG